MQALPWQLHKLLQSTAMAGGTGCNSERPPVWSWNLNIPVLAEEDKLGDCLNHTLHLNDKVTLQVWEGLGDTKQHMQVRCICIHYSPTSACSYGWHYNRCAITHVINQRTKHWHRQHAPLPVVHPLAFWQWWNHHCQRLQWGRPHPCRRWSPSSWESRPRTAQLHWQTAPTAGGVACSHGDHTWHRVVRTTVHN